MRRIAILLAAWVATAGAAGAQGLVYVSTAGHQYRHSVNANGAVLVSLYPVARFVGGGAATEIVTGIETIYLGRDCDAFSEVLGTGSWGWNNGGFVVDVGRLLITFPRQEIDASNGPDCEMR